MLCLLLFAATAIYAQRNVALPAFVHRRAGAASVVAWFTAHGISRADCAK